MIRILQNLSWQAIDAMDRALVSYLLPIASTEQHGPHLPVGTDDLILAAVLGALENNPKVEGEFLQLPAMHYGNSHEHLFFPGTVSMVCDTVARQVEDVQNVCRHIVSAGW